MVEMALDYEQAWDMLESGTLSDFFVVCGKHEFKVHKVLLYPKSPFFLSCIDGGFKVSQEGVLALNDYDPQLVAHMILVTYLGEHALYTSIEDVWPDLKLPSTEGAPLEECEYFRGVEELRYLALYELGIFLMYNELKAVAQKGLLIYLGSHWHTIQVALRRPDTLQIYVDQITRILKETYNRILAREGTLWGEVIAECIERRAAMTEPREVWRLEEISEVIERHEWFAWHLGSRLKMGESEWSRYVELRQLGAT